MISSQRLIFAQYSIVSMKDATSEAIAMAKAYLHNIEFASQLCVEFAAAESSNSALSERIADAGKMLDLIIEHNLLLKSSHHLALSPPVAHKNLA